MAMKLEQLADEVIETDFLIVGGGLAGCMAAIVAREQSNIDVAIMDKANVKTSGEAFGTDHHTIQFIMHPFMTGHAGGGPGARPMFAGLADMKLGLAGMKYSVKSTMLLERIGVKLREDDGRYKMRMALPMEGGPEGSRWPRGQEVPVGSGGISGGQVLYRGSDLKEKLVRAVRRSDARIFNRTMLTGLITSDGIVVGATGVNTRNGKFLVFKAKAVLLSTGGIQRLYLYPYAPFPTNLFYSYNFPGNHGGGAIAAYRAGAKLASMELLHVGIFSSGMPIEAGTMWKVKNSKGELLEEKYPMPTLIDRMGLSPTAAMAYSPDMSNPEIERDVFFFELSKTTDDEIAAMYFESAASYPYLLKLYKARGDPRTATPLEVRPLVVGLPSRALSGILPMNDKAETSIKNLFAIGDASAGTGGGAPGAVNWGYAVGEHIREEAAEINKPVFSTEQVKQAEADRKRALGPLGRSGYNPLELEEYIRKINNDYIGIRKTEPRLMRALELLNIAKERFVPSLGASNPHELMRVLEVEDIIELSQIHAQTSLLRTESRLGQSHYRADYPEQDDEHWRKVIVVEKGSSGEMKYILEERR